MHSTDACRHRHAAAATASALALALALAALMAPRPVRAADRPKVSSPADYARCVRSEEFAPQACLDALAAHVKAQPAQAFEAGKAVRAETAHWAAIPFFARAFAKQGDARRCADPDVTSALVAAFDLPASHAETVAAARTILFDRCWTQTQQAVLAALAEAGPGSATAGNLCPALAEKKQTSAACAAKKAAATAATPAPAAAKWQDLDPRTLAVEDPVKVFSGSEGRSVTLVKIKSPADAWLIKFQGFRGPWNGRVVLHRETPASSGFDYWTQVGGEPWVGVVARGDGWLSYEAYPWGDKGPFSVSYDAAASKTTAAKSVLDQFARQKR